jgi:NADH-quinone oxidoreductase subunit J
VEEQVRELLFYAFGLLSLGSAVLAITRKNAVSSACWLVLMFFGLAGAFVLMEAYFVAAVQVLVYAGAIMVLFLFVIMLIDLRSEDLALHGAPRLRPVGVIAAAGFLGVSVWAVLKTKVDWVPADPSRPDGSAGAIGEALFNVWLLAFEATSMLLLGGILGAVLLTKRKLT